jgi:protein SCO1/2
MGGVIGGLLRVLIVGLVLLVAALMLLPHGRERAPTIETATVLDMPRALPAVGLTDANGNPFSLHDLEGRYALVFFGYTNCPDICPLSLAVLADALERLRAQAPDRVPAVVFVSVDPGRDSPDRIRAYLHGFDDEFIGATADDATLAPLLDALSVTVHKDRQSDGSYNVTHNGTIYVLDAQGRWTALFGGSSHDAETLVGDYLAIRAQASAATG